MMGGEKKRDLNITEAEYRQLEQSLKNDEFRNLFMDYMKEIADPKNRELYEKELTALEADRGNDVRFVKPEPGYVIKTTLTHGSNQGRKVFINICTSPEIAEAKPSPVKKGDQGQSWSIPYSLGQPREDVDNANNKCTVYDCVFHPETYQLGRQKPAFDQLLVSTAIEGIEKQFKVHLDKKYRVPKMKFKGVPTMTVIRTPAGSKPVGETTTEYIERLQEEQRRNQTSAKSQSSRLIEELDPAIAPRTEDKVEAIPKYRIVYKDINADYQKYTCERERQYGARPDALTVKVQLPGVSSASQVDLDIDQKKMSVLVTGRYRLLLELPLPVNPDKGDAKFNKAAQELSIELPVIPAPSSKPSTSAEVHEKDEVNHISEPPEEDSMPETSAVDAGSERSSLAPTAKDSEITDVTVPEERSDLISTNHRGSDQSAASCAAVEENGHERLDDSDGKDDISEDAAEDTAIPIAFPDSVQHPSQQASIPVASQQNNEFAVVTGKAIPEQTPTKGPAQTFTESIHEAETPLVIQSLEPPVFSNTLMYDLDD
ncbi:pre-RNA processing PIH1/Nop17-domain-containing protein [Gaertneriomyces semiglobifer]|nr:pre-RNA processing PIH1/Nop17-domain-containing protein [Gaertneriomyces semiglobifer]